MTSPAYPSHSIWPLRRAEADPLAFLVALAVTGADVVPFYLGRRHAFLLNHPACVEDVLVRQASTFVKGRGFDRAKRLLGDGLLTAAGALHQERRRIAQGAFHRQRVAALASVVVEHAARCRDQWREHVAIDAGLEMRQLTLAIAGEALFGADLASWAADISRAVAMAVSPMDGLVSIVAPPLQVRRARRVLDAVIDAIVAQRRRAREPREDLLSLLLDAHEAGDEAADRQLRDDAVTFLLAGHDTISHALTWTWLLIAEHAEADDRLGAEIVDVVGDRPPSAEDVPRLVYTKAVLAEALRLFPPAWVIVRRATETRRIGDVAIPAGAVVVASPFVTHRDARFFADPLEFQPERWVSIGRVQPAADVARARPKLAYFPFGAGPRACIGEGFAWTEGTLVLATLAQRWRLARPAGVRIEASPRITLRPKGEVRMTPVRRG